MKKICFILVFALILSMAACAAPSDSATEPTENIVETTEPVAEGPSMTGLSYPAKGSLEEFKVECDLRRLSPRTTKGYYNNTALFLNFLRKHEDLEKLEEIRSPHIKKYVQYLLKKDLSPSYINGILKCLRAFFKYATEEEYICNNPATKVN